MRNIKLVVMDVDGTLTDGKIYMGEAGEIMKSFDIKDGYAIHDILPEHQIEPVIITARTSKIVENRCKELNIRYLYQGIRNKPNALHEVASHFGITRNLGGIYDEIGYIGDDRIDLPCMKLCRVTGCPANAAEEVRNMVNFVSQFNGGNGAVREFIEWITK